MQAGEEDMRRAGRVGDDRDVGLEAPDLLRVDVHVDESRSMAARRPAKPEQLEPRPDPEQDVCPRPAPVPRRAGEAVWAVVGDDAAPASKRHYGRLQQFRELADL